MPKATENILKVRQQADEYKSLALNLLKKYSQGN
jgi:hypothetical protein